MIRCLQINDLAIIREVTLEIGPGLTLLTGETGAGKSILVDAIAVAVGERALSDSVRTGCQRAVKRFLWDFLKDWSQSRPDLALTWPQIRLKFASHES